MTPALERRLLQVSIVVGGCVPVFAGFTGMYIGSGVPDLTLDSHFRYLSGLLYGIGLAFWYAVPNIEKRTAHVRLLCLLVVLGGFTRLIAALAVGVPPPGSILAIGMELVVTPLLCLWQGRVARRYA